MDKINFENGEKVKNASVTINNVDYEVTSEVWNGKTPLSAENLNKMQDNAEKAINEVEQKNTDNKKIIDTNSQHITELKNENEYLSGVVEQAFTLIEKEGTSIKYDNTINARFKDFKLGGDTTQTKYTGKNLLKLDNNSGTTNGVTWKIENGIITLNGTPTTGVRINLSSTIMNIAPNNKYIATMIPISGTATINRDFLMLLYCNSKDKFTIKDTKQYSTTMTITEKSQTKPFLWVGFSSSAFATFNNFKFNLQVEEGEKYTNYEPYCGGTPSPNPDYPQEIKTVTGEQDVRILGKNFINTSHLFKSARTISNNGITLTIKDNGKLDIKGTATKNANFEIDRDIYLDGNKDFFFFSNIKYNLTNFNLSAQYLDSNNKTVYWLSGSKINKTLYTGKAIKIVYFVPANTTIDFHDVEVQIEEGNTATTYESYQGSTYPLSLGDMELCKIGDYQDYIYKKDNKWWKHKEIEKIVLNEKSNIKYQSEFSRFIFTLPAKALQSKKAMSLCSQLLYNNSNSNGHYSFSNTSIMLFNLNNLTDTQLLADYLRNNNITLEYILEEPSEEEITDTTLITQLNNLSKATTYAGETNIVATSDGLTIIPQTTALTK